MSFRTAVLRYCWVLLLIAVLTSSMAAQSTGTLRGQVLDPTGAVVPEAMVTATSDSGQTASAVSNRQGVYEIKGLGAGKYTVVTAAKGFAIFERMDVGINGGQATTLDVKLAIQVEQQQVQVQEHATSVDVDPSNNASAVVIKGKDLDALSDDPDELQADLEALAGPAAGPNGGQIYIDGFTNGQLPPKSAISEIRVNTNPFSPEFDHPGFGRIEVITKPGMDQYHGSFFFNVNHSALNSRNPFLQVPDPPGYHTNFYSANFGGPLISKKASFFFNTERRSLNETEIVSAFTLDSNLNPVAFSDAVLHPVTRTSITPRLDYQISKNNRITARYQYTQTSSTNDGVGGFSLASQGLNRTNNGQSLQISDTYTINPSTINETRFQYNRNRSDSIAQIFAPTINVQSAFVDGGNSIGFLADHTDRWELQNLTSKMFGTHYVKFGGRLRAVRDANLNSSNYNGTFTFTSLTAYQITQQVMQTPGWTPAQMRTTCVMDPLTGRPACGGASQFSIVTGQQLARVSQVDAGLFFSDDWRARPNLTLSYGLRYETQNNIGDHADFAPRLALAWGIGKGKGTPKTVLRAGWGMFYDRFSENTVMQVQRSNGLQEHILVSNPNFYPYVPADLSTIGAVSIPSRYDISPDLRAPYMMQSAVALERQVTKTATLALTYINTRSLHTILTRDINAPLPGTWNPNNPAAAVRPLGGTDNIYQYQSAGMFKQNQLITTVNIRASSKFTLMGFYTLNYANSTVGAGSNPLNPYDVSADWGRAAYDVRHRLNLMGNLSLPRGLRFSPFIIVSSGRPFNIYTGLDTNGDGLFNERPAVATDLSRPTVVIPKGYAAFDLDPLPGLKIIPPNYGDGPGMFSVNMRIAKTFGFGRKAEAAANAGGPGGGDHDHGPRGGGPGGPGGDHGPRGGFGGGGFGGPIGGGRGGASSGQRYSFTISANARNLFNHVNENLPIGNLSAGANGFGKSTSIATFGAPSDAANRRIDMQVMFSF